MCCSTPVEHTALQLLVQAGLLLGILGLYTYVSASFACGAYIRLCGLRLVNPTSGHGRHVICSTLVLQRSTALLLV